MPTAGEQGSTSFSRMPSGMRLNSSGFMNTFKLAPWVYRISTFSFELSQPSPNIANLVLRFFVSWTGSRYVLDILQEWVLGSRKSQATCLTAVIVSLLAALDVCSMDTFVLMTSRTTFLFLNRSLWFILECVHVMFLKISDI